MRSLRVFDVAQVHSAFNKREYLDTVEEFQAARCQFANTQSALFTNPDDDAGLPYNNYSNIGRCGWYSYGPIGIGEWGVC